MCKQWFITLRTLEFSVPREKQKPPVTLDPCSVCVQLINMMMHVGHTHCPFHIYLLRHLQTRWGNRYFETGRRKREWERVKENRVPVYVPSYVRKQLGPKIIPLTSCAMNYMSINQRDAPWGPAKINRNEDNTQASVPREAAWFFRAYMLLWHYTLPVILSILRSVHERIWISQPFEA